MLDPKYIPLFLGGFIAWMAFVIGVGFFGSRGKREGEKFLTGGSDMSLFLIFCTLGATIIGTGSSIGAIGDGFNHGWTFYAKPDKGGETTFFPACGSMSTSNTTSTSVFGALRNVGFQCSYWSGNPNQLSTAYYLYGTNTSVNTNYGSYRQYVYPIRAAKEK